MTKLPVTGADDPYQLPPGFDTTVAHPARVYDYWLGGKDHFEADRIAAEEVIAVRPTIIRDIRANRAFLGRAVRFLAAEAGIRQFLDIGTGIPSANNTHEVAQSVAPESRIVYVDNDPIVLAHARALLTSTPEGACAYLDADLKDTGKILAEAARTLDFSRPVAVLFIGVLHLVSDEREPVPDPGGDDRADRAGQLPGAHPARQGHRRGRGGQGCQPVQRSCQGAADPAYLCGDPAVLRRHAGRSARAGAMPPMAAGPGCDRPERERVGVGRRRPQGLTARAATAGAVVVGQCGDARKLIALPPPTRT